jgi:hypothetical protein
VTRALRAATLLLGLTVSAYGVLRLLDLGWANTRAALVWLVAGVVLHDAVFAPAVLAVSLVALRVLRRERLVPWVVALVVLVPTTLVSVPELGRFGADHDNPTLLDRHYWLGWSSLVTLVVVTVALGALVAARRRTPVLTPGGDDGARDGGR